MKTIDKILSKLASFIKDGLYEPLETDQIEIKDNSSLKSDWKEIYITSSAFLNAEGGMLIIGIKEDTKNKKYIFKGYTENNETNYKQIPKQFTDQNNNP